MEEVSIEVLELAKHILEVRSVRKVRRGTPEVITAKVDGVEIPYGTLLWKIKYYPASGEDIFQKAGYIVSVCPTDRKQVEIASAPYTRRVFPKKEQASSQKRRIVFIGHDAWLSKAAAVEHYIAYKKTYVDYAAKTLAKATADLHAAEALRE